MLQCCNVAAVAAMLQCCYCDKSGQMPTKRQKEAPLSARIRGIPIPAIPIAISESLAPQVGNLTIIKNAICTNKFEWPREWGRDGLCGLRAIDMAIKFNN